MNLNLKYLIQFELIFVFLSMNLFQILCYHRFHRE